MAKFLDNIGLSRLISKIKAALNSKIDKVTSTDNAVVRFNGTTGDVQNSGVTINDNNQLIPETIGFKPKSRTFNGTGWFRIFSGTISPVHLMLTRNYYSPSPEGYDIDIETFDITVTDDLWGIATITQNAGYFGAGSTENQEIQKIRVYGYNGAPSTNPDNSDKKKLCIDVYITDRYPSGANTYYITGYSLGTANDFVNYTELTADNLEYAEFCQGKNSTRYYSEFTLVDGFKTNKKAVAQSFVKEGGTASQFLLGNGSVTTLKTVNSTSLLGSGNIAVQPTLVSGTNIKTINNTSLLGSGNISVQTPLTFDSTPTANSTNPVTSGGIKTALDAKKGIVDIVSPSTPDGTFIVLLDNGDDITVDFNHSHPQYQETLVSGTNIKTINNNSLLGSGNINVVSDVKLDNVSLVTNNIANIPHDILQLDGWDFDSDIGGSSITDAQYNTIVLAAADHKLIKIGDTLVTVREDTDTDYYIICGITTNDEDGELAVKALKVTKQSYSGEHYLANGGLISGSTIEQQILTDLANYLPLSGGTMSGAIKFPVTAATNDNTQGINFVNGNTLTAHIGSDTSNNLGIYTTGKIILRPNGANSSATSNGSITIDNSGVIVNENITAEKFITSGGTSGLFVKGNGELGIIDEEISISSTNLVQNKAISEYIVSRGENLVTNGFATLGTNYNFSAFTLDLVDTIAGTAGSFKIGPRSTSLEVSTNEYMPVDVTQTYRIRFSIKNTTATLTYLAFMMYDADYNAILSRHYKFITGSLTRLARELKNGDTTVYLEDVSGFTGNSSSVLTGFIFWNYTNSKGYTYPPETYSRNEYAGYWSDINVAKNTTNNTITLTKAWDNGTFPAGTYVSQHAAGSSWYYPWTATPNENTWVNVNVTANGGECKGTAFIKLLWITNYSRMTDNIVRIAGVSLTSNATINDIASKISKVTSTNNAIARFDGTGGAIKNSSATVDDNGNIIVRDVIIHGSNTSNNTRTISSDTATNLYFNIGNYTPLVLNQTVVRSSIANNGNIDLGATNAYWNNVYGKKFITQNGTSSQFLKADGSIDSTSYAPLNSPALTGTPTAPTASLGTNTTLIATTAFVQSAIDALPEPMIFKGSLGTGGTITSLPVNGTADVGDTYKVITDGTYAGKAAKAGDTFICLTKTSSVNTWELIPSGDEPSGTVTSVGMTVPTGLSVSGSPITTSGTLAVSFASGYSIPTTTKQGLWDTAYSNNHTHSNKSVLDGISSSDITNWNGKANIASPTFTGTPAAPTAAAGTNTTQIATTAFVQTAVNNKVHYVANLLAETTANYITEPEFKSVKINGSSTNTASSSNCVLLYDTTNECLKFIFN